jgi:glycosyltransferase involved in cell wall biosynthesis
MKLSLIIPSYDRQAILCHTLKMAVSQDYSDYEVIVVDQTEEVSEELRGLLKELGARVQYIRLSTPNLAKARNVGISQSTGDVIVFIDDDVIIDKDYLSRHALHYSGNSKIGGVVGLTWPVTAPDERAALAWQAGVCRLQEKLEPGMVTSAQEINGTNTSFQRRALLSAGLFDESLEGTSRGEDTDISMRVRRCGYQLLVDTTILLVHLEIPSGGCGNRDPSRKAAVHREHVELATYVRLKNWSGHGVGAILRTVWESYRALAVNRSTVRGGMYKVARGHIEWLVAMTAVSKRLIRLNLQKTVSNPNIL